ncbi:MAG: hypothetical protein H6558_15525 [Lewinellaceae bacterium]|nr:hypothetical protein [Lewinellaceae bacterium]
MRLIKSGKSQKEGGEYEENLLLFLYGVQQENQLLARKSEKLSKILTQNFLTTEPGRF